MKNKPAPSASSKAPEISCQNGTVTIRVARKPHAARPAGRASASGTAAPEQRHAEKSGSRTVVDSQPAPRIPGITKEMVRRHLPELLKEKVLAHRPATLSEWLLVEWHLARKLHLSPLQMAHFIPEAVQPHQQTRHHAWLLSAR